MKHTDRIYMMTVKFADGTSLKPVIRQTEKGRSDYANRMYSHYLHTKGEEFANSIVVESGYMDDNLNYNVLEYWKA